MRHRRLLIPIVLIALGTVGSAAQSVMLFSVTQWQFWGLMLSAALTGLSLLWLRSGSITDEATQIARQELDTQSLEFREQIVQFEETRSLLLAEMDQRSERLKEREHILTVRFARFQEFLEYPLEETHESRTSAELQQLSEQDRKVHSLLEEEAERVYEKIRRNGYSVQGKVDVLAIRDEAHQLFRKVAMIYKPGAENPLLETSFEQLARAASRVCLHVLVLLEQLPINVQQYNISTLYGYFQKAVTGYGVYQKATPWLSYLSRGLYAGRIASATNPATIGAWWLATEIGKRGAAKFIENVVDRQAITVLHQVVAVVGIEAACIYGTGFRQRDPAWILGTELVELIQAFPQSGDSLRNGMKVITGLPLKNEYDRIYLYRCLADHRSAGRHVADSAMLTRDERERIARVLEEFFSNHIHGMNPGSVQKWRDGAEQRLDLRMNLQEEVSRPKGSVRKSAESAVRSLSAFLHNFVMANDTEHAELLKSLRTFQLLDTPQQEEAVRCLTSAADGLRFEPPELDPTADITNVFLSDLATCATSVERPDDQVEQLVGEMFGYFRHPSSEAIQLLDQAWRKRLRWCCNEDLSVEALPAGVARAFFEHRGDDERLIFCYTDLHALQSDALFPLPNQILMGLTGSEGMAATEADSTTHNAADGRISASLSSRRAIVVGLERDSGLAWQSAAPLKVERRSGILLDSAEVHGGTWSQELSAGKKIAATAPLVIEGSLRGGRFRSYFRKLLEFSAD